MTVTHDNHVVPDATPWTKRSLLIVASLMLGPMAAVLATDIYVPSMPSMAREFGVPAARIQESLSLNLISFGLAHLLVGPLTDAIGRRIVLLGGLTLFIAASLLAANAENDTMFIVARLIQGAAAAAPSVTVIVLIRELFDDAKALTMMGIYAGLMGTMPAIGPILGGLLHEHYGWHAGFIVVAGVGTAALLSGALFIREAGGRARSRISPRSVAITYGRLLGNPPFLTCAAIGGLMFAGLYAFVTAAPFALIEERGITPAAYGFYQGLAVTGYLVGASTMGALAGRATPQRLLTIGLGGGLLGGTLFLGLAESGVLERIPELVVLPVGMFVFGLSIVVATVPILGFSFIDDANRGAAAAVLGGVQVIGGGLGAHAIRAFDATEFRTMALALAAAATLAAFTYVIGVARIVAKRQAEKERVS